MRLHHANISVFPEQVEDEIAWLTAVLGYKQLTLVPDPHLLWFEADDKTQLHLSRDPGHAPEARAHIALEFEDLLVIRQRLEQFEAEFTFRDRDNLLVINCDDPAGNHWELRQDKKDASSFVESEMHRDAIKLDEQLGAV